ncbi:MULTISPECIES: hypothetical protein [unclassified Arthrobacter]|uniref:hypothetical protein n=1 Tax=unclassified Arthrobacter TaxID=235627 RepID=UPI000CE52E7C|nr:MULTISPECIES: hypothetical protein [unclassified Arthrobacter]
MSSSLHGADPDELREFARALDHAHSELRRINAELSQRISGDLRWEGPDAFVFKHAWRSSYSPVITQTATMLEETSVRVKAQAAEQESASA